MIEIRRWTVRAAAAEQFRVLHPERELALQLSGDLRGSWDRMRLHQLLTNLLRNAFQHGDPAGRITLSASSQDESISVTVHNQGQPIDPALLTNIFEPLRRGQAGHNDSDSFSMGLGLYIADTITRAHQGTLSVQSSGELGTSFTARLPREPSLTA